jgi:glycosyltransferase involved in cell wall biosynthesis
MTINKDAHKVIISSFDNPEQRHYNGGGVAVVEMIARRLSSQFHVTVLTAAPRAGIVIRDGVRYKQLPIGWAGPRAGQLLFNALLPGAARLIPHDLWIVNFTPPFSTSFLPLFSRAPVLGLAQTLSGEEMSLRYRLPFHVIERFGLRFYRDVVVLNPADREAVSAASPSAMVRLIPNGIPQRSLDERFLGAGNYIFFIGRIDVWRKGLDLLLGAYQMSGLGMPLIIAGTGVPSEEQKFQELLDAASGNVHWVGHVSGRRKQELLEGSAFLVLPSRFETFGLSALEGMSYAKPVLHFDLPTLSWMGRSGHIPPYDLPALAERMRELADDEAARCEMGRKAHAVAQSYVADDTADRYLRLVQDLLDMPGADTGVEVTPPCS